MMFSTPDQMASQMLTIGCSAPPNIATNPFQMDAAAPVMLPHQDENVLATVLHNPSHHDCTGSNALCAADVTLLNDDVAFPVMVPHQWLNVLEIPDHKPSHHAAIGSQNWCAIDVIVDQNAAPAVNTAPHHVVKVLDTVLHRPPHQAWIGSKKLWKSATIVAHQVSPTSAAPDQIPFHQPMIGSKITWKTATRPCQTPAANVTISAQMISNRIFNPSQNWEKLSAVGFQIPFHQDRNPFHFSWKKLTSPSHKPRIRSRNGCQFPVTTPVRNSVMIVNIFTSTMAVEPKMVTSFCAHGVRPWITGASPSPMAPARFHTDLPRSWRSGPRLVQIPVNVSPS